MNKDDISAQFRTSRFLQAGEDRMVQAVQDKLRSGPLLPLEAEVAEKIDSANRSSGSPGLKPYHRDR